MNTSTCFQDAAVRLGFVKYRSLFLTLLLLIALSSPLWFKGQLILFLATQAAVMMLVAIGLNLLMGYAGLVSLGHGALVAIGGYTTALLMVDAQISFWIASLAGVALATVTGVLMALPALRLSTWYFALVTLTFSQVVSDLLVEWKGVTKGFSGIVGIPAPTLFGRSLSPVEVYIVVAACVVLAFILSRNLVQSRIGRGMVAARDNPLAATAAGVSIWRIKLFAFAISAALAGLGGAFFAVQKTVITPEDFNADFSIFFLLTIVVGGLGRLWGPVVGTLVFFLLPELLGPLQSWRLLIYGVILLVLMVFAPHGITGMKWWRRWFDRPAVINVLDGEKRQFYVDPMQRVSLVIRGLKKHFGGVKALDGCDLHADSACVHALVGPNGSGKTTILNAISGFVQADEGSIIIGSVNVMKIAPHQIARLGVGRTFQTPKLLNDMTVLDNVQLGGFVSEKASAFEIALRMTRATRDQAEGQTNAMELLLFVGLAERANDIAGDLPHGQQRLVEIARAMVSRPSLLLLDEPAAGLSLAELDRLGLLIEAIVARGTTVLVVEHHLELIARISRSVTVLDRGCVLAAGTPEEVFSHPEVERAYMGREAMRGGQ